MDPSAAIQSAAQQGVGLQVVILVILLGLSAFFSSAETALTTVNKIKIRTLVRYRLFNLCTLVRCYFLIRKDNYELIPLIGLKTIRTSKSSVL